MRKALGPLQLRTLQPKMEGEACRESVCISIHDRVRTRPHTDWDRRCWFAELCLAL